MVAGDGGRFTVKEVLTGAYQEDLTATLGGLRAKLYGVTSGGVNLPIKVVDDGSGFGKVVCHIS